jgi:signal transduction histidine kinase
LRFFSCASCFLFGAHNPNVGLLPLLHHHSERRINIPDLRDSASSGLMNILHEGKLILATNQSITRTHLQRVLLIGLFVSALLLLSALLVAFRTARQIDQQSQTFADRLSLTKGAMDEIEKEQTDLNANWLKLAKRSDTVKREEILQQLAQSRSQMSLALESAYEQAEFLRETIYQESHGLLRWNVWLFCSCVCLSLLCGLWLVRASTAVFARLEQQARDLTDMQYQFLETQENVARRFSHELHDELGQALTAVKANLSSMRVSADAARVEDCLYVVDEAIQNVREMSQLLRPTVLDDFGLDAALRVLTDNFAVRTGMQVDYKSNLDGRRLTDETETALFRIAQEALTNVARHSGASAVELELRDSGKGIKLKIQDNGKGYDASVKRPASGGLGLAGMRTRALGCGGDLKIVTSDGKGVEIQVECPIAQ